MDTTKRTKDFDNIVAQRCSIRKYADKNVCKEQITEILESARLAPSAVNCQPWRFVVCVSEHSRNAVYESYPREWFKAAPIYIVACGNGSEAWMRPADGKSHLDIDIAIAVEHIVLKVTDLDLATCWVCNFDPQILKEKLSLEEDLEPIVILPIGYPREDDERVKRKRKSLDEIVRWI